MKNLIYISFLVFVVMGCSQNNEDKTANYPECINTNITAFLKNYPTPPNTGTKASVKKYLYKEQKVYVLDFMPGFADGQASVINEKCESICTLGGIGSPLTDCIDWDKATFVEIVWIDPR